MKSDLEHFRKELHQHPEISGKEKETAERIRKELEKIHPDEIHTDIGGHGILACFKSSKGSPRHTILFRAELDAVPVQEETGLPYQSKNRDAMHACGHDGHMTILIGLAKQLKEKRPAKTDVHLLFQPAEETGEGAAKVLNDSGFGKLKVDHAYALHNLPGFPAKTVVLKAGPFAAGSKGIEITVKGSSSHAAYPERGLNPAVTVAQIIQEIQNGMYSFRKKMKGNKAVCTFIKMGEKAYGISPGKAVMGYTVRSASDKNLQQGVQRIHNIIKEVAGSFSGEIFAKEVEPFRVTVNSKEGAGIVEKVSKTRGFNTQSLEYPFPWSEDFGVFGRQFPITIFGLGAGEEKPPLHSEKYDFNDELTSAGVKIFTGIVDYYESI